MTELKTLKDIQKWFEAYEQEEVDAVSINDLRQEAIKWHKHLKTVTSEHDVWDFIEQFFNITEEELK